MLHIDDRVGSQDMHGAFERLGVPAELTRLDACDVAFVGRGIEDEPITIGIELKRMHGADAGRADLITSLRSGRLAGHQLGGMQAYDRAWLITEGLWRANSEGAVEVYSHGRWVPVQQGKSTLRMTDLEAQILTITQRGGVSYWHCPTQRDTIRFIATLYRWWTDKSLDEHRSHQAIYLPPPDRALFVEPSLFLKVASCLPGVGWDRAIALEAHFAGSLIALMAAGIPELTACAGIGITLAARIYTALHDGQTPPPPPPKTRKRKHAE